MKFQDRIVASAFVICLAFWSSSRSFGALTVDKSDFGTTRDNQKAELYTLTNSSGMAAKISTYGALLVELDVPDKTGKPANIVLGYATLAEYERGTAMYGALVGRYANRIAGAKFSI